MTGNHWIARALALAALVGAPPAATGATLGALLPRVQPPGARFTLASAPTLVLGRGEAEGEFFTAVAGASRMPDGSIVVGDRGKHAMLRFDRAGALQQRFARQGKGPGEVQYLLAMHRCGDTLDTLDINASRLTRFTLDGRTVGSVLLSPLPYRTACAPDGRLVAMGWERNEDMREGGNVWVQHYPRAASASVAWTVFSPAGVHLGATQTPAALEVYEIDRDYVLGRYLHPDDGVPEVREYRLTRR